MTIQIYPILFSSIQPGDMKAIEAVSKEADYLLPTERRKQFEMELRRLFSLDEAISLKGIV